MATEFETHSFAVPMANMNLPPGEVLNQIMDNLNHLNVIVNQAVNTIHFRIKQESKLLSSIAKRIDNAYKKTALIASNPNKSTTIYSLSNYPNNIGNLQMDKPLINKTAHNSHPIAPKRSNYNLSLKQRNQKPTNTETVSLLHSIHQKTQKANKPETKTQQIPQWVQSVADCMVFGTNRNAYSPAKNSNFKRRREQKRKKSINKRDDNDKHHRLAAAPPSICDKYNNVKTQQKMYGDRIKYQCVLDRDNMPKYRFDSNLFHAQNTKNINTVSAVTDIKWKNNEEKESFIPSDVLNEHEINIQFEDDDSIKPPVPPPPSIPNEVKLDEREEEKAELHIFPTPKDIVARNEEKRTELKQQRNFGVLEAAENGVEIKQSFVFEADAQNESLQKMDKNIEEEIIEEAGNQKKERFVFDVNALRKAREGLKKKKVQSKSEREEERKNEIENEDGVQGTIFSKIQKLRKFHADSDDEGDDDRGSFDDSD